MDSIQQPWIMHPPTKACSSSWTRHHGMQTDDLEGRYTATRQSSFKECDAMIQSSLLNDGLLMRITLWSALPITTSTRKPLQTSCNPQVAAHSVRSHP